MTKQTADCRSVQRELAAAAGEALAEPVAAHLEACATCRSFAEACRALAGQGRTVLKSEPDFEDTDALRLARRARLKVTREGGPATTRWFPRWTAPVFSASLSATAVILVLGLGVSRPSKDGPRSTAADPAVTVTPEMDAGVVRKAVAGSPVTASDPIVSPWVTAASFSTRAAMPRDLDTLSRYARIPLSDTTGTTGSSGISGHNGTTGVPVGTGRTEQQPEEVEP